MCWVEGTSADQVLEHGGAGDLQGSKATFHKRANWTPGHGRSNKSGQACWAKPKPVISPKHIPRYILFITNPQNRGFQEGLGRLKMGWLALCWFQDTDRSLSITWSHKLCFFFLMRLLSVCTNPWWVSTSAITNEDADTEECIYSWHGWWAIGFSQTLYVLWGQCVLHLATPHLNAYLTIELYKWGKINIY